VTRLLSGATLLALFGAAAWWAPPGVVLAIAAAVALLAAREYGALSTALGAPVAWGWIGAAAVAVTLAMSVPAAAGFGTAFRDVLLAPVVIAIVLGFAIAGVARGRTEPDSLARVASPVFGALYVGLPLGAIAAARARFGRDALVLLIVFIAASDTAQYYSGRLVGRHLLAPVLSPKKTVEGAAGGLVLGSAALAVLGAWWWPVAPIGARLAAGAVLVTLGICGDLFESMLKRAAGLKDSAALIPGHGGVLDRVDALLFVAPIYYLALGHFAKPA
jgi:phosphatidate cytidylyltransferase